MTIDDDDRPPVLAHQRFAARRSQFTGLNLADRFAHIHATNVWGAESSRSGLGSERAATSRIARALPDVLRRLNAAVVLDAPFGDGGWIDGVDLSARYIGLDIVPDLIERLSDIAGNTDSGRNYVLADTTTDPLPHADAILCRDCLVHLSFANIQLAITNMKQSGARWLIATTFTDLKTNHDCEDGDWRALNFEKAPFSWGAPSEILNEGCTEAGGGWADKSLGVWGLADL